MKKFLLSCLLGLVLAFPCFASNSKEEIKQSTHGVYIANPEVEATCTSTAIGTNTIMIATHCIGEIKEPGYTLFVFYDKEYSTKYGQMAVDTELYNDGNDHTIIVLKSLDLEDRKFTGFDVYLKDINSYTPQEGEKVFFYGVTSSLKCRLCYHEGIFSGWTFKYEDHIAIWFQLSSYPGDSGSLIFNEHGNLVGMVAFGPDGAITGSLGFAFTEEQLSHIK